MLLSFFVFVGFVDLEFEEFVFNGVDFVGCVFLQLFDYNVFIGVIFQVCSGWFGGSILIFVDEFYIEIVVLEIMVFSECIFLVGCLGYGGDCWCVYFWGCNLFDDEYEFGFFDGMMFGLFGVYG